MGTSEIPNFGRFSFVSGVSYLGPRQWSVSRNCNAFYCILTSPSAPFHASGAHYNSYSKSLFRGWLLLSALLASYSDLCQLDANFQNTILPSDKINYD